MVQEPHIRSGILNDSVSSNQELVYPVNRLQGFNLLLLSITHFATFCDKRKYIHGENKNTKSFT